MPCTCGQCVGGILSPRMAYRLDKTAAASADLSLDSLAGAFRGDHAAHDPEIFLLYYCPPELRVEVSRPFAAGFANAMAAAGYLARQRQLPKPRMVAQMMSIVPGLDKGASKAFLERGGCAEYALDAVLARIEEEMEGQGDGSFAADEEHAKALAALPQCRNDEEFQLLRQQLFSNSDFWPCGPYPFDEEEHEGAGVVGDDGWVHYDTSNWKPPAAAAAAGGSGSGAEGAGS
ncbi:ankyrin repeat family [Micractinium conductrix]|uniref:Ankyrin repeat family n=1 Tax=Micractinium conductrix TaxID=554055 RepID=A0A2P6V3L0_9CHLO|nr:ankyrin repeat family [Micractinium conductrix]|eukprot:PSC68664.1 ankyrin repeat family [Micractinium conductrix]